MVGVRVAKRSKMRAGETVEHVCRPDSNVRSNIEFIGTDYDHATELRDGAAERAKRFWRLQSQNFRTCVRIEHVDTAAVAADEQIVVERIECPTKVSLLLGVWIIDRA